MNSTNIVDATIDEGHAVGPLPPYDPECHAALDSMAAAGVEFPGLTHADDIPANRKWMEATLAASTDEHLSSQGRFTVSERQVPGPEGAPDITLLICTPTGISSKAPVLYHTHGGGMIIGNRRTSMLEIIELAHEVGAVVVSVEYRLAPEHPSPANVEDCYAGLVWTVENADELGIDPERVVIVGASAGGGLCAGTTLMARDRQTPRLLGSMLMCPMIDDRNNTASSLQSRSVGTWTGVANGIGWEALLGDSRGGPDVSYYAAPARATDLSGLPPTFIDVGSAEVFRSEAVAYAEQIWTSGGDAEPHVWPGGFHGYDSFAPQAPISQATVKARTDWLRRLLAKT